MSKTIIDQFTVKYQKDGGWTAQNGDRSASFGSGSTGYYKAIRHAIQLQYPALAQAVLTLAEKYDHGDFIKRAWRAALIVIADGIITPGPAAMPGTIARVISQKTQRTHYYIRLLTSTTNPDRPFKYLSCTCPDYEHGAPVIGARKYCKHVLAVQLMHRIGQKPRLTTHDKKQLIQRFADHSPVPPHAVDVHAQFVVEHGYNAENEAHLLRWWKGEEVAL